MICALPEIDEQSGVWRIPLWPRTALRLLESVQPARRSDRAARLERILSDDPCLVLWTLLLAEHAGRFPFRSLSKLAQWFERWAYDHVIRGSCPPASLDDPTYVSNLQTWQCRSRWIAEHSRAAAAPSGSGVSEWAYLLGSVWIAPDWPCPAGGHHRLLPAWLVDWMDFEPERDAAGLEGDTELAWGAAIVRETAERCQSSDVDSGSPPSTGLASQRVYELAFSGLDLWLRHRELRLRYRKDLQQEKLRAMHQFAYGAGHEINNPLTNITLRAEILRRDESDPSRQRLLDAIRAQAYRAYQMIADMMLYAKPPDMQLEGASLAKIAREAVAELAAEARQRGVRLTVRCDTSDVPVVVDPVHVTVAIKAILQNALEAVQTGGRVGLEVLTRGDRGLIRCRDDGPGLSPQARRHLFDPFYSGREAGRGLGFGLCKAWRIVSLHGGRIDAHSVAGEGTTIEVVLPLGPPADRLPAESSPKLLPPTPITNCPTKPRRRASDPPHASDDPTAA